MQIHQEGIPQAQERQLAQQRAQIQAQLQSQAKGFEMLAAASEEQLQAVGECAQALRERLHAPSLRRWMRLFDVLNGAKASGLKAKIKLGAKLALRCVGIKKQLPSEVTAHIERQLEAIEALVTRGTALQQALRRDGEALQRASEPVQLAKQFDWRYFATQPLISVMLPVYNHADYVSQTIESVQAQTYPNWELIVLDDGSTDNLLEVLQPYLNDSRIRLYAQPNQKLPAALTNLHALACGDFLTWISADNRMLPPMLSELALFLLMHPACSLVYADVEMIDKDGAYILDGSYRDRERDPQRPQVIHLPRDASLLGQEQDNFINACFLYRKEASQMLSGTYATDLIGLEDYDYWLRLAKTGDILHLDTLEPLYQYRVHENTMSAEIVKNTQAAHLERQAALIAMDQARERMAGQPWNVRVSEACSGWVQPEIGLSEKRMEIRSAGETAQVGPGTYPVTLDRGRFWIPVAGKSVPIVAFEPLNPLCRKAKYIRVEFPAWVFPRMGERPVVGIHSDLSTVNRQGLAAILAANPHLFFMLCDTREEKAAGEAIAAAHENCQFVGQHDLGADYNLYATWDALLIAPSLEDNAAVPIGQVQLAWSIGVWALYPQGQRDFATWPFCAPYESGTLLPDAWLLPQPLSNEPLLSAYLEEYSPQGRMRRLKRYLNAVACDQMTRPDFGAKRVGLVAPVRVGEESRALR